jgi:predicted ATP-binding protein involved in virulence
LRRPEACGKVRTVSSLFRLNSARFRNFRSFASAFVPLHRDLTVVYAENGGGKTALLNGLAVALGAAINPSPRNLIEREDVREIADEPSGTAVPQYPCLIEVQGRVANAPIQWSRAITAPGRRSTKGGTKQLRDAMARVLTEGADWPVFAFYGTQRLWDLVRARKAGPPRSVHRLDGYTNALDPRSKEEELVNWLFKSTLAQLQGGADGTQLAFLEALRVAAAHSTAHGDVQVQKVEYDMKRAGPAVVLSTGERVPWDRMSDGFHVFLGLVADLARRCVTLNPQLGADAVQKAQGTVLIDEIDLHLHPRWQRVVVPNLRAAFPNLQFVISTHSPQVLSSVENDQVVGLVPGQIIHPVQVAGRDTNSLLRDVFGTSERDQSQPQAETLKLFYRTLDDGDLDSAAALYEELQKAWGDTDPEVVRASRMLEWTRDEKDPEATAPR